MRARALAATAAAQAAITLYAATPREHSSRLFIIFAKRVCVCVSVHVFSLPAQCARAVVEIEIYPHKSI